MTKLTQITKHTRLLHHHESSCIVVTTVESNKKVRAIFCVKQKIIQTRSCIDDYSIQLHST